MKNIKNVFDYSPQKDRHRSPFEWDRPVHTKDDVRELNRLLRLASRKKHRSESRSTSGRIRPYSEKLQRVTFKQTHSRDLKQHVDYINTYIRQLEKKHVIDKPETFGTPNEEYFANIAPLHFKCVISPENTDMDYETLAKVFIERLEYITGHGLYWKGAIHTDTGHRHLHICINGKDTDGKDIFFDREMISHTMREMLQDIATKMIGPRTQREIEIGRQNMLKANRWTKLDNEIEAMKDNLYTQTLSTPVRSRLEYLSKIKLAEIGQARCHVAPEWKEVLQATGRYNTFLEVYSSSKLPVELYDGGPLTGRISRVITFNTDEAWNNAIVVDQADRRVYVPLYHIHRDDLEGKEVTIKGGNRKMSRQLTDRDMTIHSSQSHSDISR